MPTQILWVKGLRREDEERVAERLRRIDGVFAAVLSHQDQCAEVELEDDRASLAEVQRVLAELGFESQPAG